MAVIYLKYDTQFLDNVSIVQHFPTNGRFKLLSPCLCNSGREY